MDALKSIESWYLSQCDGDWEHQFGIKIETLDNPGWHIEISLAKTALESRILTKLDIERSEQDWICCKVKDNMFIGHGGPENLKGILEVFLAWASDSTHSAP
ncbi:MAG: immunity 53 family protein [Chloroflexota bacterium]|nr:immunity 53 family protein [Chloroflexota bacterium]